MAARQEPSRGAWELLCLVGSPPPSPVSKHPCSGFPMASLALHSDNAGLALWRVGPRTPASTLQRSASGGRRRPGASAAGGLDLRTECAKTTPRLTTVACQALMVMMTAMTMMTVVRTMVKDDAVDDGDEDVDDAMELTRAARLMRGRARAGFLTDAFNNNHLRFICFERLYVEMLRTRLVLACF